MTEEQIELAAQLSLQEFDDARDALEPNIVALGQQAIAALDALMAYWQHKPYMQDSEQQADLAEGEDHALKQYAERQIAWANSEKERVAALISG